MVVVTGSHLAGLACAATGMHIMHALAAARTFILHFDAVCSLLRRDHLRA